MTKDTEATEREALIALVTEGLDRYGEGLTRAEAVADTILSSGFRSEPDEWWILTGGFMSSPMSRLFSGPYSTKADAHTARTDIERIGRRNDLFIDSRPVPQKVTA